ncbi:hypothetical protein B0H14DRAFT_2786754, partial [Mycena olivaceomarginata]
MCFAFHSLSPSRPFFFAHSRCKPVTSLNYSEPLRGFICRFVSDMTPNAYKLSGKAMAVVVEICCVNFLITIFPVLSRSLFSHPFLDTLLVSVMFMNISQVFPSVNRERLLHNLRKRGVPENFVRWTASFVTDRYTHL